MRVELKKIFGNDTDIVDVARASFDKESIDYTEEQNTKLLQYLVKHGHTSTMRHCYLRFKIQCPIYVERQIFKHQVGISTNSISGRYVDFKDSYHKIPVGEWRKQSASVKQGSEGLVDNQQDCYDIQEMVIDICQKAYKDMLELGVCKEQARTILPINLQTQFVWSGTLLAFIHLCNLRLKPDAQKETRDVVNEMLKQVKEYEGNPFGNSLKFSGL